MAIPFSRSVASLQADSPRASLALMLLAALLLGGWAAWLFGARVGLYEVTAQGRLEVSQASQRVQAPVAGRVARADLVLGQAVAAGDLLVELDSETERLQLAEAQARRAALAGQVQALATELAAGEQALRLAEQAHAATLEEAQARQKESQVVARFTDEKARRLERVGAGQLAELDLLKARAEAQKDQATLDTLREATRRQDRQQLTAMGDRLVELERLRTSAVRLEGEAATLDASIRRLEHEIAQRLIRAPIAGTLGEISQLGPGTYVQEGDLIAAVVPAGELRAVAHFSAAAALGRIRPGQPAWVRLHGFPWTQYGGVRAAVARVGSEAHDGRVRVELSLAPDPASPIPLQHGLPAEVEVEIDRVSPAVLALRAAGKALGPGAPPAGP